eukprot:2078305-Pyramimonas_sp.AAC.1
MEPITGHGESARSTVVPLLAAGCFIRPIPPFQFTTFPTRVRSSLAIGHLDRTGSLVLETRVYSGVSSPSQIGSLFRRWKRVDWPAGGGRDGGAAGGGGERDEAGG